MPGLLAVHEDASGTTLELGRSYAAGLGLTPAGVLQTTFAKETETGLFGVQAGFETLVEAGYQPEAADFECLHELELIVDMMYEGAISWMRHSVSTTAEYGDDVSGPRVVNETSRAATRDILTEIESGGELFGRKRDEGRSHPVEVVGKGLRAMMPFIDPPTEEH